MLGSKPGRHGHVGLSVRAKGDLEIDAHHTMEDIGLVLGRALREALGSEIAVALTRRLEHIDPRTLQRPPASPSGATPSTVS